MSCANMTANNFRTRARSIALSHPLSEESLPTSSKVGIVGFLETIAAEV